MDPSVIAAMAKWPNVPDCRGWLSLDRRGQWRLQGSPVRHAGLADFIGRNYGHDESGAWFMQNGPQRAWVELAVTPWVFRLEPQGHIAAHTGRAAGQLHAGWLVDGEGICLMTDCGLGVVDDRDLHGLLAHIRRSDGTVLDDLESESALESASGLVLDWYGATLPLRPCTDAELPAIGGFRRSP